MNHTTEELILAAHVRELALKVRAEKLEEAVRNWERTSMEPDDDQGRQRRAAFKADWQATNSVASFASEALSRISAVADAIKHP